MLIRELQENDFEDFYDSLKELSKVRPNVYNFYQALYRRNYYCKTFVAVIDNKVVGTASLIIEPKFSNDYKYCGHLEDVAVNKNHQGQGVARALIEHIIKYCKEYNYYKIILDCDDSLVGFYEKFGFKENRIAMRLDL